MSTRNGQTETLDRVPPHNLDAERAVLGSVLLYPDCLDDVLDVVREPAEFHGFDHQVIFRELLALHHAGQAIDVTLLAERLTTSGMLDSIGGLDYLAEVVNAVPTAANAQHYAGIVREKARLRALIAAALET
ncbi:MAG: replicative DNA helicase, partial [Planctomycetaceae bacterium]|nr:replicative DNA helicase [Planctomycetaceae bacterium]